MAVDFVALRQPGPLAPEQVEQCLHDIERRLTSSNAFYTIDVILRSIRPVLTASASELRQLIESPEPAISANAVAEALLRGEKRCLPNLARSALRVPANTDRPDVAALYVHAIALLGGQNAHRTLRELLSAPNPIVRMTAGYELSFFGDASSLSILREAFRREAKDWHQFPPHFRAVRIGARLIALGDADSRSRARSLLQALSVDGRYLLPALAERRKPKILQMLREMSVDRKQYHGMRKWAVRALGRVKDRGAVPYLLRALDDPVQDVNIEAVRALEDIGDSSSAPALRRMAEKVRPRNVIIHRPDGVANLADEILRVADALEHRRR